MDDVLADAVESYERLRSQRSGAPGEAERVANAFPSLEGQALADVDLFGHLNEEHLPRSCLAGSLRRCPGEAPADLRTLAAMTETAVETPTFRHFIAGEWCDSTSGRTFESRNPADTRDVVGRFQQGTKADVAMAIKAAETARADVAADARRRSAARSCTRSAALMAQHKERLARAMTREMGKVLAEARGDVQEGIDIAYLMAGEGRRMFGDTVPSELPDKWAMSIRQPIGIAGIITPWNFPMAIPCWKIDAGARDAATRSSSSRASDTPHCATLLVELMAEAGFPPGVVNLVTGSGGEVGDAIVESPDIAVISFTGSSATGKRDRRRRPARGSSGSSLELGGKNGVVVLADADLDLATDGILWSAFGTTGQRCTAARGSSSNGRVVEPLLQRLEARARELRLGLGARRGDRRRAAHQRRRRSTRSAAYIDIGRGEGELITRRRPRDRWRPGARPLLRADDLRRRRADGPHRPGGDLRAGPLGHPGRRLRRGDAGAQPDPLRAVVERSSPAT